MGSRKSQSWLFERFYRFNNLAQLFDLFARENHSKSQVFEKSPNVQMINT